jgi:hypothetical protein
MHDSAAERMTKIGGALMNRLSGIDEKNSKRGYQLIYMSGKFGFALMRLRKMFHTGAKLALGELIASVGFFATRSERGLALCQTGHFILPRLDIGTCCAWAIRQ